MKTIVFQVRIFFYLEVLVIPDICPFRYTATLFRPVKSTPKSALRNKIAYFGQNGPQFRVLYAQKYTGSKKVHHRRLCGWDKYQLWSWFQLVNGVQNIGRTTAFIIDSIYR